MRYRGRVPDWPDTNIVGNSGRLRQRVSHDGVAQLRSEAAMAAIAIIQIAAPATAKPTTRSNPGDPSENADTAAGIAAASSPLKAAEAPMAPRDRAM